MVPCLDTCFLLSYDHLKPVWSVCKEIWDKIQLTKKCCRIILFPPSSASERDQNGLPLFDGMSTWQPTRMHCCISSASSQLAPTRETFSRMAWHLSLTESMSSSKLGNALPQYLLDCFAPGLLIIPAAKHRKFRVIDSFSLSLLKATGQRIKLLMFSTWEVML